MAIDEHDGKQLRCRRLGHVVPFGYCRNVPGDGICRLILDCWWETFDVEAFLQAEQPEALARLRSVRPPSRMETLVDLIRRAQSASPPTPPDPPNPPPEDSTSR